MAIFLAVVTASLAWALYAFLSDERRYRAAWSEVELPAIEVGDAPYRSATVRPRLARATWLVRLTAFACLWIGQSVAVVMFIPAIVFRRSFATGTVESGVPWRHSLLAYELGTLLLQRHRHALPAAAAVVQMLRVVVGTLAVLAAIGLMGGHASHPTWWITVAYAALTALLVGLISVLVRRHSAAFEQDC